LGYNWKIGIALLSSFAAREVFVGTMATIYNIEDPENISSITQKMKNDVFESGEKVYSAATGVSLMIFYAFAMQCMSTLAITYRETKHIKWPLIQFLYMSALAYCASFIVYQIMR
jgi:ferrous iron transport protein B